MSPKTNILHNTDTHAHTCNIRQHHQNKAKEHTHTHASQLFTLFKSRVFGLNIDHLLRLSSLLVRVVWKQKQEFRVRSPEPGD